MFCITGDFPRMCPSTVTSAGNPSLERKSVALTESFPEAPPITVTFMDCFAFTVPDGVKVGSERGWKILKGHYVEIRG